MTSLKICHTDNSPLSLMASLKNCHIDNSPLSLMSSLKTMAIASGKINPEITVTIKYCDQFKEPKDGSFYFPKIDAKHVERQCKFPIGSTVLDLRYFCSKELNVDIMNILISGCGMGSTQNHMELYDGICYVIRFRFHSSETLGSIINYDSTYVLLSYKDIAYLQKKYDYTRKDIAITLKIFVRFKDTFNNEMQINIPYYVNPLLTFGQFKSQVCQLAQKEDKDFIKEQ